MTPESPAQRRGAATQRRAGSRLRLEQLEDRSVPATFNVTTTLDVFDPADGKRSLREAITAANGLDGADLIVVPAGVYKITDPGAGDNQNRSGDLDLRDAVTIRGAGAGLTIIDGQQLDRVFDAFGTAPGSIAVVLEKMTVRNGSVDGHGGGVQVVNANLVVRDCAVNGNRASESGGGVSNGSSAGTGDVKVVRTTVVRNVAGTNGGGLGVFGSSLLTVKDSTVRRNVAGSVGGGIATNTATLSNCAINGNTTAADGGGINSNTATLTNCTVSGNSAASVGGGIRATTATLIGSTVSGNSARFGGGIATNTATLTNCTVSGNTTSERGGGINAVTATLTNSTVSGNNAGESGGGIAANTATLTNSTVSGNSADSNGGGLTAATATLTNSTVSGNSATADGGGINAGTATLTNCTVSGNSAGSNGGGIAATTATLTNSTVSSNTASERGGGINADTATLTNTTVSGNTAAIEGGGLFATTATLLNCTVVENIAVTGGGLFHVAGGTFSVKNTIVALNLVAFGGIGPDAFGASFTSQGHNLIGDGSVSNGFTHGVNGDIVGTSANPIIPKVAALANNGGPTKTHALLAGSPAIDRGDNVGAPAFDQRGAGFPRKKDGNFNGVAIVDIGAFER